MHQAVQTKYRSVICRLHSDKIQMEIVSHVKMAPTTRSNSIIEVAISQSPSNFVRLRSELKKKEGGGGCQ